MSIALFVDRRVVVHLNRYDDHDDLHRRNIEWLRHRHGLELTVTPEALARILRRP